MKRLLILLVIPIFGCAHFICRPGDSGLKKTGKVSARVLVGLCTFGMSEMGVEIEKNEEKRAAYDRQWWRAYHTASPQGKADMRYQRAVEDQERAARMEAAMWALGNMRQNRMMAQQQQQDYWNRQQRQQEADRLNRRLEEMNFTLRQIQWQDQYGQ